MPLHLEVKKLSKTFTMHILEGKRIEGYRNVSFDLERGAFLGISGKSGCGKSSLLRSVFRNYEPDSGSILFHDENAGTQDLCTISDAEMLAIRKTRIGYVSQFFRTIPRITTMHVVIEPLIDKGWEFEKARNEAEKLFIKFGIPKKLWDAFPSTFSGGEKQRINMLRAVIDTPELMLLDEPTASLDLKNRTIILDVLKELKKGSTTFIGVFHDMKEMELLADEIIEMQPVDENDHEATSIKVRRSGIAAV